LSCGGQPRFSGWDLNACSPPVHEACGEPPLHQERIPPVGREDNPDGMRLQSGGPRDSVVTEMSGSK